MPNEAAPHKGALTDFLSFTFPFEGTREAVSGFIDVIDDCFGLKLGMMEDRKRGFEGYEKSFQFDYGGAVFAFGGKFQRGTAYMSMPGAACALVEDWGPVVDLIQNRLGARITRWDGAHDDFSGAYPVDLALEWYQAGVFGTGGNKPSLSQIGNWVQPDGRGRTLYIGRRQNGKMLRVYEKGKQLGDPLSPWTRWEVEFHNRDRVIPPDVLLSPGQYLAGSYACLGWIHQDACRIRTTQTAAKISYEHLTECLRTAYGPLLNVMLQVEGSAEAVLRKAFTPGVPKRLQLPDVDLSAQGLDIAAEED